MEAFTVAAIHRNAVADPDFVADGADVGGLPRHASISPTNAQRVASPVVV